MLKSGFGILAVGNADTFALGGGVKGMVYVNVVLTLVVRQAVVDELLKQIGRQSEKRR